MTHRDANRFRIPGPLGHSNTASGVRTVGPLGFQPVTFAVPSNLQIKAAKKLKMPAPAGDSRTKLVRDVSWDLFKKGKDPAVADVHQGQLANCTLASLLGALANTPSGRKHIKSLIAEYSAVVETDVSAVAGELDSVPAGKKITSSRYFAVTLGGQTEEVSSVFYTDDADEGWSLIYMSSANEALWPCLIEKAYAQREGSYGALDSGSGKQLTLNQIWKVVVGSAPEGFEVNKKTPVSKITSTVSAAGRIPAVAASGAMWHGFTVLGMKGSKIELYDPMTPGKKTVSMEDFRNDFSAILYGSP
ncbi:MAG: hypothetical protein LC130_17900 [Bryobacterales bacterium]|nr:hypothetical protein [Bryobacterales bacterium]MEB2360026.1 C2 family cysteine protease [Bryobacterales bacterium]